MQLLQCVEPHRRPALVAVPLDVGDAVDVWVLADFAEDPGSSLRATVVRMRGEHPPPRALLALTLELVVQGRSGRKVLRVLRTGPDLGIELVRPDLRSRVSVGMELQTPSRLEVLLADQRRTELTLALSAAVVQDTKASVAGSGTVRSQVKVNDRGVLWLVPTAWTILTDQQDAMVASVRALAKRLGLTTRTMALLTVVILFAIAAIYNYRERMRAQEEALAARDELTQVQAAREASLLSEMACLAERQDLVGQLGDLEAQRRLDAERALGVSAARSVAIQAGGQRQASDAVLAFDTELLDGLKVEVAARIAKDAKLKFDATPCLAHASVLGADLPRYLLVWHPDPALTCPMEYAAVQGGLTLAGRFGLSGRIAQQFGPPDPALTARGPDNPIAELLGDPRMNDRWSAHALAMAMRDVQTSLLTHPAGGRPVMVPSQSQLWALTVLGALNAMPSPAEGTLDQPSASCVRAWLDDLVATSEPARPGEPLLPDLVAVALGEVSLAMRPTPGCPWQPDRLPLAAQAALSAVAHSALADPADTKN